MFVICMSIAIQNFRQILISSESSQTANMLCFFATKLHEPNPKRIYNYSKSTRSKEIIRCNTVTV